MGERRRGPGPAHLKGAEQDFRAIARLFEGAVTGVEQQADGGWVLVEPELDAAWDEGGARLHDTTVEVLRDLNGVARALEADHRPVRATGHYDGPGRTVHVVGVEGAVEIEAAAVLIAGAGGGRPVPPPGPVLLAKLQQHAQLAEALHLLGGPDQLTWYDLWKVFEVAREACGDWNGLLALGCVTAEELHSFKRSANDPVISKGDARHARMSPPTKGTPPAPMGLSEARQLMSRLVRGWSETL